MAIPQTENITVLQGATFTRVVRWDTGIPVFKAISAIDQVAPAAVSCAAHGVPSGWPVAIVSVKGMVEINTEDEEKLKSYTPVEPVDADNLILTFIDASCFRPYESGGYVKYNEPVDLTGFSARMHIRKTKASLVPEVTLDDASGDIVLDNVAKTIKIIISDTDTAALTISKGVYDLELVSPSNEVFRIMEGSVTVSKETTKP